LICHGHNYNIGYHSQDIRSCCKIPRKKGLFGVAKSFLRSGSLNDFLALGENGQPVYASALQLRETLRLRRQQSVVDCLALPQPNDTGDRIDWYSPIAGKVTSWAAANKKQRTTAIKQLEQYIATVTDISQKALKSDKASQQLFGILLSKAFQFPDQNYVYLVDGKPVITFWGFVKLDKKSRNDVLDCLKNVDDEESDLPLFGSQMKNSYAAAAATTALPIQDVLADPLLAEVPSEKAAQEKDVEYIPRKETENIAKPAQPAAAEPTEPPHTSLRSRRLEWIVGALVVVIAGGLLIHAFSNNSDTPPHQPAQITEPQIQPEKRVLSNEQETTPHVTPQPVAPQANVAPVSTPAAVSAPAPVSAPVSAPAPQQPAPNTAPAVTASNNPPAATMPVSDNATVRPATPLHTLVVPSDAIKTGELNFLDGNWNVSIAAKDPITGKPPMLKYHLKNGSGTARINYGDGTSCRAEIEAGFMRSGNLVINSRQKAKCSDGSKYQVPEIVCKQTASGPAECKGRYDANTILPMTIKHESE
jgi:hypothetical protein